MDKKYWLFLFSFVFVLAAEKVDINTASLAELDEITGIGPVYAQRIIDGRPYSSVDDLLRVKGIGEKTLQKIKDQGLACVACAAALPTQANSEILNPKSETNSNSQNSNTQNLTPITYPGGVFINEILPSPQGPDETDEWIELYNSNNFDVDLSGCKIQDSVGTATSFTILQNTKILANNFLVFKRPDTKIMLNNDEDGLTLLDPNGETKDAMSFSKAQLGLSYNKIGSNWQWSATLTPGAVNITTAAVAKAPSTSSGPVGLPKTEKSDKNDLIEAGLASLNPVRNEVSNGTSPWLLFFTALAITLILAALVLFIKLKLKSNT